MFGKDNIIQAQRDLQIALTALGKAQSQVSSAIGAAADTTSTPDTQSGSWGTLHTAIATAITNLNTAIGDVYFYPEQTA